MARELHYQDDSRKGTEMFGNYLNVTFRNLKKHKLHSIINVLGLSIGLACCLLIFMYVKDEFNYDRFHENADQIFRLAFKEDRGYKVVNFPISPGAIGPALVEEFHEILSAVRIRVLNDPTVRYGRKVFNAPSTFYADGSVFEVFSFSFLEGDPNTALVEPRSVVITEKLARKYFGTSHPIGKIISIDHLEDCKVTGVLEEIPQNSHFHFDMMVSMTTLGNISEEWQRSSCYTYLLMDEEVDYSSLESKFQDFLLKYRGKEDKRQFYLQPLTRIHLHSNLERELEPNSDINYIYILSAVAFFVLLIACINFINLNTARSAARIREAGIRKVVGAQREDLIKQFLFESICLTGTALLLGMILIELSLPLFNAFTGKNLNLSAMSTTWGLFGLVALMLFVGALSGSYPALFISSFKPVQALKETWIGGAKKAQLRKFLVVFQFCLSIVMIIGTCGIHNQLKFIRDERLGFDKEHMVVIRVNDSEVRKKYDPFKRELLQYPLIQQVTASTTVPGQTINPDAFVPEGEPDENWILMGSIFVDSDYIRTMGIELVEGRDFSENLQTDLTDGFILTQAAVKKLGWTSPIGKKLGFPRDKKRTVIGIVNNFHYLSKHRKIDPVVLALIHQDYLIRNICIKIRSHDIQTTLAFIENKWKKFSSGEPFLFSFLDEDYEKMYRKEHKLSSVFQFFTFFAIFVSCLGLFGLVTFSIEQRTKEVGIRKVLGASASGIMWLVSKDFAKWILIANIFSWPLAYLALNLWLQSFAYRSPIHFWIFFLAGGLALIIALLTVSFQSVKAAMSNPVTALRYE